MGHFQGPKDWGRLLTAMVTPFKADGSVDYDQIAKIANYLVEEQANDGIVVSGTTGESPTLSEHEKIEILKVVLDAVGQKAAVVFGAGTYNTAESVQMARAGESAGAHGIMLVNPYYSKPGQRGLEAHFRAIAAETSLPVMIYNIQPRSAINLETETLVRLSEIPNVVAVKEASGNISQVAEVCRQMKPGFRVYSGDDALTLPMLSLGAYGLVSVVAHVVGRDLAEMIHAFCSDPTTSRALHHRLSPVFKALFSAPNPTPVKFALSHLAGFNCESVRLPLVTLTDEEKAVVIAALNAVGLKPLAGAAR